MAHVMVIEGKPAYTPKVKSAHFSIPTVNLSLAYDDAPVATLRSLPKEFLQFEKHFWECFAPKISKRIEDMNKAVEQDVRDWETHLATLEEEQRGPYADVMNKDLHDWINRWLRLVEGDCSDCCGSAYEVTMQALKKDAAHAHFTAAAKAVTTGSIKIAAAAVVPHVGLIKAAGLIITLGKSLKTTYDKFKTDWGAMEVITEAIAKDISDAEIAKAKYLKAKASGKILDKAKAFVAELGGPSKKLEGDVAKLDKAIAITRAALQEQSAAIHKMEEELKKSEGDADFNGALHLIEQERTARATVAQVLKSAEEVKVKSAVVLAAIKASKEPEFAELSKAVGKLKAAGSFEKEMGGDVETLLKTLAEILQHHA